MCSKPCLRDVCSWTPLVLAGVLWCCSLATALHAQVTSSGQEGEKKRLVVRTNGAPIPFATVLNTSTGQAMAADAQGVVMFPAWGPTDTLRVQSLGYEELTVVPGAFPLSTLELQPAMFAIEEVVVASNALTGTAMSNMGVSQVAKLTTRAPVLTTETTGDLLEGSGQVHLQMSQQGGVSPVLRGFEANRVLLVVDGVRMNNAIYRAGHVQNAGTVDPFAIQRTDVIMGPSSVLYGSDALGGVVHFVTQAPRFSYGGTEVKGKVLTQGNTANGGWAGHAEVAVRAPRWGSVTQVSHRHFGDLRMGSWRAHGDSTWGLVTHLVERRAGRDVLVDNADPEIQAPTGYSQWDIQQRTRLRLREGFVDVNVQHSTTTDVPRFDVYNDRVGTLPKWAEWRYGPQERTMLSVTHQKAFSGGWVWTTLGSLQDVEESRIKRRFAQDVRITQLENVRVWGWTSVLRGRIREWRVEGGLDGQWNRVASSAKGTDIVTGAQGLAQTRYADGGSSMNTWGAFASAQRNVGSHEFRGGLRYSHAAVLASFVDTTWMTLPDPEVNQQKGALTASGSWTGPISPHWQAVTSVASGFRHPNVDDLGKVREKGGYVLVPNADLKPEYLYTAEQAATWMLRPGSDVLVVQGAAFASLWHDAIVQANASLGGDTVLVVDGDTARIQMNQNLDRAWVRGARLEVSAKLWPKTTFRGVVNWTRGTGLGDEGVPLAHIPPTFGLVELVKKGEVGRVGTSVRYAFEKRAEDYGPGATDNLDEALPTGTPEWAVWNVEGSLRVTEWLECRVSALNLLDLHYRTFGSGISAPGRNVRVTATARF